MYIFISLEPKWLHQGACFWFYNLLYFPKYYESSTFHDTHSSSRNYYMENYRNKQFIRFTLRSILSSVMKSQVTLLHAARNVNHPFVQHVHASHTSHQWVTYALPHLRLRHSNFFLDNDLRAKEKQWQTFSLCHRQVCKVLPLRKMLKTLKKELLIIPMFQSSAEQCDDLREDLK